MYFMTKVEGWKGDASVVAIKPILLNPAHIESVVEVPVDVKGKWITITMTSGDYFTVKDDGLLVEYTDGDDGLN